MHDTLTFATDDRDVILEITSALTQHGLQVVRSFDLRGAQAGQAACVCQEREGEAWQCQLVFLLVYSHTSEPLTLVVSGCGQLEVHVAHDVFARPDPRLVAIVWNILVDLGARLNVPRVPLEADVVVDLDS